MTVRYKRKEEGEKEERISDHRHHGACGSE